METDYQLPDHVELEPEESVVLSLRQHWFVFRDPFLLMFFVPFLLFSLTFFIEYTSLPVGLENIISYLSLWGSLAIFVIGLALFLWKFYLWRGTLYLVTNKRLILIKQMGLFSHDDRETSLSMIQDARATVDGVQPSLYGFGNVTVQISGEDARIVLEKVAHPREVQHTIIREAHLRS